MIVGMPKKILKRSCELFHHCGIGSPEGKKKYCLARSWLRGRMSREGGRQRHSRVKKTVVQWGGVCVLGFGFRRERICVEMSKCASE